MALILVPYSESMTCMYYRFYQPHINDAIHYYRLILGNLNAAFGYILNDALHKMADAAESSTFT